MKSLLVLAGALALFSGCRSEGTDQVHGTERDTAAPQAEDIERTTNVGADPREHKDPIVEGQEPVLDSNRNGGTPQGQDARMVPGNPESQVTQGPGNPAQPAQGNQGNQQGQQGQPGTTR